MIGYDYICNECLYQETIDHPVSYFDNPTEEITKLLICPKCGKQMVRFYGTPPRLNTWKSKTKQQQIRSLKQRSHDDFNKNIKEKKEHMQGEVFNQMRKMVKKD
jgi:hypothetical protein